MALISNDQFSGLSLVNPPPPYPMSFILKVFFRRPVRTRSRSDAFRIGQLPDQMSSGPDAFQIGQVPDWTHFGSDTFRIGRVPDLTHSPLDAFQIVRILDWKRKALKTRWCSVSDLESLKNKEVLWIKLREP